MKLSDRLLKDHNSVAFIESLEECYYQAKLFESLLKESAELFRFYEDSHRKRGPEHFEKAERNAEIAKRIEKALGA